tara:strand:+ start:443 stop:2227 length:1785 start_codon:yes stop_codon:yes gene_type:complete
MRPLEIIAEVANAHQGDVATAAKLAAAAVDAGADAVKFQVYFGDELLVRAHPRFEHFRDQAFPAEAWPDLIGDVQSKGGRVYCDVFGLRALDVAAKAGADGFKIHTSDLSNSTLLNSVRDLGKPVYLSAGGSTARELATAIAHASNPEGQRLTLMHGYQSFPTAVEDSCLVRIGWLQKLFGGLCDVGYQDHVAADDPFSLYLPLMALGAGARVIEKHITFDRAAQGIDWYSSVEPDELAKFIETVRAGESALGQQPEAFTASERKYRRTMKKFWVTTDALPAGHVLTESDLILKRVADDGPQYSVEREKLVGRALIHDVGEEYPMTRADVKTNVWSTVVARSSSKRMPGKAQAEIAGMSTIRHLLERLKQSETLDNVLFCTTTLDEDDPLAAIAEESGWPCYRGSVTNVLSRMLGGMADMGVDVVVRVTGDDILVDPDYLDRAVRHHLASNAEYSSLKDLPSGTEVEVFDYVVLRDIAAFSNDPDGTEYLTWYVTHHGDQFRQTDVPIDSKHAQNWRLTIDTPEDFDVVSQLLNEMAAAGKALTYRMDDIVAFFEAHPDVLGINSASSKRGATIDIDTGIDWRKYLENLLHHDA